MRAFLHLVCVPLCFVNSSEGRKEGVHRLLKEFLRLRIFNALISFLACELRGDVELLLHPPFPLLVGLALVTVVEPRASDSKHIKNKSKRGSEFGRWRYGAGESKHESAGMGGRLCSIATCS